MSKKNKFAIEEKVSLEVTIKNVNNLYVKLY